LGRKKKLEGKVFGTLTVVGVSEVSRNGHYRYHVECSCGVSKTILGTHLLSGKTKSCGCAKREHRNWKGCGTVGEGVCCARKLNSSSKCSDFSENTFRYLR